MAAEADERTHLDQHRRRLHHQLEVGQVRGEARELVAVRGQRPRPRWPTGGDAQTRTWSPAMAPALAAGRQRAPGSGHCPRLPEWRLKRGRTPRGLGREVASAGQGQVHPRTLTVAPRNLGRAIPAAAVAVSP